MKAGLNAIIDFIKSEPVAVAALVSALITLGVAFGLSLSPEQKAAIIGVADLVLALIARQNVSPVASLPSPKP